MAQTSVTAKPEPEGTTEGSLSHKRYGPAMAVHVVISSMVGVGVLTTSGYTVASVGSNQLMILLWLVGGIVAL
jgi:basic amino acid/polyamine antiporter, APA family